MRNSGASPRGSQQAYQWDDFSGSIGFVRNRISKTPEEGIYHGLRLAGGHLEDGVVENMIEIVELRPQFVPGGRGPGFW